MWKQWQTVLGGSKITADGERSHEIKIRLLLGRKATTNLDSILKRRHYFANKSPSTQSYGFCSSHVWMWELDYKESWVPKNWCFELWCWGRLLRVPWTKRRSNHSILKEIFIGRTDAKAETPIVWPLDEENWLTRKDPDAGKNWRQEEKGTVEDEMVVWHHQLDGPDFEQALGVGDGQGSLACCSPWGCKESDTTEQLNWMEACWRMGTLVVKGNCDIFSIQTYPSLFITVASEILLSLKSFCLILSRDKLGQLGDFGYFLFTPQMCWPFVSLNQEPEFPVCSSKIGSEVQTELLGTQDMGVQMNTVVPILPFSSSPRVSGQQSENSGLEIISEGWLYTRHLLTLRPWSPELFSSPLHTRVTNCCLSELGRSHQLISMNALNTQKDVSAHV